MVGQRQIIVNGLGHAQEFLGLSGKDRVVGKLFDGIHGVVSADIDKRFDIEFIEDLEDLLIDALVLVDLRQFEPAGSKKRGRRSLQKFNIQFGMDLG